MPAKPTPIIKRGRAIARAAKAERAAITRTAEAAVVRWQWCSRPTTSPEPAAFECGGYLERGAPIASKPKEPNYATEEGFDRQGRLVVSRAYRMRWNDFEHTFYTYEPGEIIALTYPSFVGVPAVTIFTLDDRGRVTATETVSAVGSTSQVFRFDDRGNYSGFERTSIDKFNPYGLLAIYDFETDDADQIVRTWYRLGGVHAERTLAWKASKTTGSRTTTRPGTYATGTPPAMPTKTLATPARKPAKLAKKPAKPTKRPGPKKRPTR